MPRQPRRRSAGGRVDNESVEEDVSEEAALKVEVEEEEWQDDKDEEEEYVVETVVLGHVVGEGKKDGAVSRSAEEEEECLGGVSRERT